MTSGLIRCGHCGQANRVSAAAAGTPHCAKCHQPLPWIADAVSRQISQRFQAQAIPTLLVLRGGRVAARQTGAAPLPALRAWVDNALASPAP